MTAISDSLVLNHILWKARSKADMLDILHIAKSGKRKVLAIQDRLNQFRWIWEGNETDFASLVAFYEAQTRANSWYIFYPVSRKTWASVDIPCVPRLGDVQTITTNTVGNPHSVGIVGHGWATGDRIYISGATGADAADINGIVHTITRTSADAFTLDGVDTTGKTINNDGSAALYSFTIRGTTTSSEVVKIAGVTKTLTTHYTVTQSAGTNGESVIRFTAGNGPTDGQAVTCAFVGRRRFYVWFADTGLDESLEPVWENGEYVITVPFNLNEDIEDD